MNFSHFCVPHRKDGGDNQRLERKRRATGGEQDVCEVKTVKWEEINKLVLLT